MIGMFYFIAFMIVVPGLTCMAMFTAYWQGDCLYYRGDKR